MILWSSYFNFKQSYMKIFLVKVPQLCFRTINVACNNAIIWRLWVDQTVEDILPVDRRGVDVFGTLDQMGVH